jgi:predicted GNAT superfamily acetyltransferase
LPNLYGTMRDGLNAGLPSDRFQVDWWIASGWVADRSLRASNGHSTRAELLAAGALCLNLPGSDGTPQPPDPSSAFPAAGATVIIEVPVDFLALKAADPALALRWRLATRTAFQTLFGQGYAVTDFVRAPGAAPTATYVLTQTSATGEPLT